MRIVEEILKKFKRNFEDNVFRFEKAGWARWPESRIQSGVAKLSSSKKTVLKSLGIPLK